MNTIKTDKGDIDIGDVINFTMGPGHQDEAKVIKIDNIYKDLKNKGRVEVIDKSKRVLWVYPSQVKEIKKASVTRVACALTLAYKQT